MASRSISNSLKKFAFRIALGLTVLALPAAVRAECSQDGDNPPARGGTGSLSVTTTPEKAVVYLGGIKYGPAPVDSAAPSGRHTLTIMLNGEELVNERVNVCAGEKTIINKELKMPYGNVAIKTNPLNINAKVTIDGEQVGSTKGGVLTINRLEAGSRVISVSNGKRHREVTVNILPEETVEVNVDFKK